jgi:hypothetical protein
LLNDASHSGAFRDKAAEAASRLGISCAQGIALVYDFDYQAKPDWQHLIGPLTFLGTFPFRGTLEANGSTSKRDLRIEMRELLTTYCKPVRTRSDSETILGTRSKPNRPRAMRYRVSSCISSRDFIVALIFSWVEGVLIIASNDFNASPAFAR